jgi:preprotein translocase subunit YajC
MDALLFPVLVLGAMWLLLIRPQQKRAKAQKALLANLEVGDQVITVGGIVGRIVDLHDREMVIETAGTQLRLVRGAIGSKIEPEAPTELESDPDPGSPIA